jgi:hypothetical protein
MLVLCALAAACVDLGHFHQYQHGDSIVPVLTSLYSWTPHFWETDRIGMLLPLVALPFRHPLANLLVQDGLAIFLSLASLFLLPRYVLRTPSWRAVGALAVGTFLACAKPYYQFHVVSGYQPYLPSLALGLGGLILLEHPPAGGLSWRRLGAAIVLFLLGQWVNPALSLVLGPVVVFRWLCCRETVPTVAGSGTDATADFKPATLPARARHALRSEIVMSLGLLAVGTAFARLHMKLSHYPGTETGLVPVRLWPQGLVRLAEDVWRAALADQPWPWVLALATGLGVLALLAPGVRRQAGPAYRAAIVLAASAVTYGLILAGFRYVVYGGNTERFAIPSLFLIESALLAVAAGPLVASFKTRSRQWLAWCVGPSVLLAAVYSYGLPSLNTVRADLDANAGKYTQDILDSGATHIAGNYWKVWPAVFHANLVLHERGEGPRVWGLTIRSGPTQKYWGRIPIKDARLAVLGDDQGRCQMQDSDLQLRALFGPLTALERRPTLWVFRPQGKGPSPAFCDVDNVPNVHLIWLGGYYQPEYDQASRWRWCGPEGDILVINATGADRIVRWEMGLATGRPESACLQIEAPFLHEQLVLDCNGRVFSKEVMIPRGQHVVRLSCGATPVVMSGDPRELVFRVINLRFQRP